MEGREGGRWRDLVSESREKGRGGEDASERRHVQQNELHMRAKIKAVCQFRNRNILREQERRRNSKGPTWSE
eukprot:766195-Hanusia_phi.AAC.18